MAFEVCEPGVFGAKPALERGQVSIAPSGVATFRTEDLTSCGIEAWAVVMTDQANLRVAIRRPQDGEQGKAVKVSIRQDGKKQDSGRRTIRLERAIVRLGLTTEATAARLDLAVLKPSMLILNLADKGSAVSRAMNGGDKRPAFGTKDDPHAAKPRFAPKTEVAE